MKPEVFIRRTNDLEKRIQRQRGRNDVGGLTRQVAKTELQRTLGEIFEKTEEIRTLDRLPVNIGIISTILAFLAMIVSAVGLKVLIWVVILIAWAVMYVMKKNRGEMVLEVIDKVAEAMDLSRMYEMRLVHQEAMIAYAKATIINRPKSIATALLDKIDGFLSRFNYD